MPKPNLIEKTINQRFIASTSYISNMDKSQYTASFNAASLLHQEHVRLRDILLSEELEENLNEETEKNEFLQIKTLGGRKRIVTEIKRRANNAPSNFWQFFFDITPTEQKLSLFYLCLKSYPLLLDYHIEVSLQKVRSLSLDFDVFDLQMRLDEISSIDEEVDSWSDTTKRKTISVYMRMLNECGLLNNNRLKKPQDISTYFQDYYNQLGEAWFLDAVFL